MTIRVYSLLDVLQQLNSDSTQYMAPNANEVVSQFINGDETLSASANWSLSNSTPYSFLVADQHGPEGFWLLNDPVAAASAFDSNPYNFKWPGVTHGTVTFGSGGPMNGLNAATFDGSTAYITAPSSGVGAQFDYSGTSSYTIAAWVYLGAAAGVGIWPRIIERETYVTRNGWSLLINNSSTSVYSERWAAGVVTSSPSFSLTLNTWTRVIVTYDGAKIHLYINGAEIGTGTATVASVTAQAGAVTLGGVTAVGGSFFNGRVAAAGAYPVALTPAQVALDYAWATASNVDGSRSTYNNVGKRGLFSYPNPPRRGSNLWGSALWGSFTWG